MKYKNYRNSKTNDNRIYTTKEIKNMTLSEIFKIKEELLAQNGYLQQQNGHLENYAIMIPIRIKKKK